jgi:ABC-type cobalamin/Fe3+-siderophores transport system ATPase subunit
MTNTSNDIVLETRHFSYRIGDQEILHDVSFQIRRGEYVSIVGLNGAGKTTLLKVLDRLTPGGSGEVDICGISRSHWVQKKLARIVAFVPQADRGVLPFTVEQFLLMCRYPYLNPFASVTQSDRALVQQAMADTETAAFAKRRLDTLSSGERKRVYIASALAQGASIWLLDEPITFLDYQHQDEVLSLIAKANKEHGTTIVIVTHDLNRAVLESDRILALRDGRVAYFAAPKQIMMPDALQKIYGTSLLTVAHPNADMPMIVPQMSSSQAISLAKQQPKEGQSAS